MARSLNWQKANRNQRPREAPISTSTGYQRRPTRDQLDRLAELWLALEIAPEDVPSFDYADGLIKSYERILDVVEEQRARERRVKMINETLRRKAEEKKVEQALEEKRKTIVSEVEQGTTVSFMDRLKEGR